MTRLRMLKLASISLFNSQSHRQSIYNKAPPLRNAPPDEPAKPSVKKEVSVKEPPKIDVDAKPIYEPAGKPITQVNIDEDLPENDKPWRRPGTDITDYFNYGFDEFTWALYASKQETIKSESQTNKKMFDDMSMMFGMGGMGAMPGMPSGTDGIPPEMQQMMQQMMASGMDPSQMDPSMFGGAAAGGAPAGNQGQGFGGQGGFGQGQNAYGGYDQQQQQGMEGNNRRGNFRGRGGRRGGW